MAGQSVSLETLKSWLAEGSPESESLVGSKWIIVEESSDTTGLREFAAILPKIPLTLLVIGLRDADGNVFAARLVVETPISTADLDLESKVKLYRRLLTLNRMALVKYYIYGEDNTVAIAVDLDLKSLSKEEFEDALARLLLGFLYLGKLDERFEKMMKEKEVMDLGRMVLSYMERGKSREEIIQLLVEGGLSRDLARDLVNTIYSMAGKAGASKSNVLSI